jgi:hypothetical protein
MVVHDCANISQSFSWFKSAFIWDSCCIYHIDHNSIWSTSNRKLPIAALVGVMVMVAIGTFEWISFRINKMPKHDIFVGILVAIITIMLHNLALAVLIGVIISALVFAWESAAHSS